MRTRARTTWLVTGIAVVAVALIAALFTVPKLLSSDEESGETISHRVQPRHTEHNSEHTTSEYWTEERMREAEPAGPVAISPVPYSELAASAGILIVAGTTLVWLLRRQRRG
ncbi:hypothetical protein SAMN04487904_11470 [Actinopolyspora lacussalsi subsp. righensis]|uniref:Uncharacterized protein n=1 Tax=Actinopolyspora righensis TaxID=995060 RepID=A0A1I7C4E9_9ACTN|nr:hypothetical protein [Actinopolyspora righensis]SFT94248.1 hypothetical protein SAMN04487904_11470 [Actinopolyspora righensis]